MSKKFDTHLANFFIFNSSFGPREGEEFKKILYYYPASADVDTKIRNVGLCEAIIKFTQTFSDKPCESLHTQKTRELYLEAEKDYWMVMTVGVPYSQKTKEHQTFLEYHEDDVQDSVYEAVLSQCYQMFKLFNGTMANIVGKHTVSGLRLRLEHFFSKYLLTLKLNQSDILDVFHGIHFLPLDKNTYLRIQCFINLLEASFPQVNYTAFLYNDQLVWSGLEQEDMRTLYTYLTTSLLPSCMEHEFQSTQSGGSTSNLQGLPGNTHYGRFILGPPNVKDESQPGKIPRVYVTATPAQGECYLLVYKALSASICLVVKGDVQLNFELFQKLDRFLGPQLSSLASDIGDQYAKKPTSAAEAQFKYVYFNHMNLAQKTTIHCGDGKRTTHVNVPPDVLRLLADLNHDLKTVTRVEDGETIVKTCSDCWVVSKKSDQREFYVILNQKSANLIEINEEVKKLCATHFNNIFFLD